MIFMFDSQVSYDSLRSGQQFSGGGGGYSRVTREETRTRDFLLENNHDFPPSIFEETSRTNFRLIVYYYWIIADVSVFSVPEGIFKGDTYLIVPRKFQIGRGDFLRSLLRRFQRFSDRMDRAISQKILSSRD